MRLVFHGGAREVGRSCVEVFSKDKRYLLDAGVKFLENGFSYPEEVFKKKDINAAFLSHAHLDHSGALPLFEHQQLNCHIIGTSQTKVITKILLRDSYKVARIRHLHPAYSKPDLKKVWDSFKLVRWEKRYPLRNGYYSFYNAGHIPGSASVLLSLEGKRILYTGDLNTRRTRLMKPATPNYDGRIDLLICESTYGDKELPERRVVEQLFKKKIKDTLDRGGQVLIPVFSLGRAQEVLIILSGEEYEVPVYLDGLCVKLTKKILTNPSQFVDNKEALAKAFFEKVRIISSEKQREQALSNGGVFITTSGMLQGGPVLRYLEALWPDEKSAILLTGFQCKHTNGRHLLEEGFVYLDGWRTYPKCEVEKFDFSGHLSREDIKRYVEAVNPERVAFVHGDNPAVDYLTAWASEETGCEVFGPRVGDELRL